MSTYRALPANLHTYAEAACKYFAKHHGLPTPKIEQEVHPLVEFRPTLQFATSDRHIVCAEVVEELFPLELQQFMLSCRNHGVPVKLFAVAAHGQFATITTQALKFAQENGIGILEVHPSGAGTEYGKPISLSLTGLRDFKLGDFPAKYRSPLRNAIDTFKQGNPSKGCSEVYDELEQLTRRIGKKCESRPGALRRPAGFDWSIEAWANVLEFLKANLNPSGTGCPDLRGTLFNRVLGLTEYRNESGHKPNSVAKLIERDKQLRTRFESAMDELGTLIRASAPLRV